MFRLGGLRKGLFFAVFCIAVLVPATAFAAMSNGDCLGCHRYAIGAIPAEDFSVGPVNFTTACRKCHDDSLVGSHPYHNTTGNCGAVCHVGWGASTSYSVPTYRNANGAFASSSSASFPASTLHVIHANNRWMEGMQFTSSKCGSCHAVAACDACHDQNPQPSVRHAGHDSTMTATWTGNMSAGVNNGVQTQNGYMVGVSNRCGAAPCHNTAGVALSTPNLLDNMSHPANGYGYVDNTVTTTGVWRPIYAPVYTKGQESFANDPGATLSVPFTGTQVVLIADKDPYRGISEIFIDGVSQGTVDQYQDTTAEQVEVFRSPTLAAGTHTITVSATGTKRDVSRGTYVTVDQFKVYAGIKKVAPDCVSCHADRGTPHGTASPASHVGTDTAVRVQRTAPNGSGIIPISPGGCSDTPSFDRGVYGWSNAVTGCHDISNIATLHAALPGGGCLVCHGAGKTPSTECYSCHKLGGSTTTMPMGTQIYHHLNKKYLFNQSDLRAPGDMAFLDSNANYTRSYGRTNEATYVAGLGWQWSNQYTITGYTSPPNKWNMTLYDYDCEHACHGGNYNPDFNAYGGTNTHGRVSSFYGATSTDPSAMWYTGSGSFATTPTKTLELKDYFVADGTNVLSFDTAYFLGVGDTAEVQLAYGIGPSGWSAWSPIATFSGSSVAVTGANADGWVNKSISLGNSGSRVKIRFVYNNGAGSAAWGWGLNNIQITGTPAPLTVAQSHDPAKWNPTAWTSYSGPGHFLFSLGGGWYPITRIVTLQSLAVPATGATTLSFMTDLADRLDAGYVEASSDGGTTWQTLTGLVNGVSMASITATKTPSWVPASYDLSSYANKTIKLRFRYVTSGSSTRGGWGVDNVGVYNSVSGGVFRDDFETVKPNWVNDYWVWATRSITGMGGNSWGY